MVALADVARATRGLVRGTEYIGAYSVPDGYFGGRAVAHVVLDGSRLIHVFPSGWHRSPFLPMDIQDAAEARYLIENHPNGRGYYQ